MWIWALLLVLPCMLQAQQDCSQGACYPPVGDILIGRASDLRASSTCGLEKVETFCTPYGEWKMKCCNCDSRQPYTETSHEVANVISTVGPLRWWQSQNDIDHVSLQLELDGKYQLSEVMLDFRGPLPDSMFIERSSDFGMTWQVYQYLAHNCALSFPHVRRGHLQNLEDVRCQEFQVDPTQGGMIRFSPVESVSGISTLESQRISDLVQFTNLRVNLTQLTRFPARRYHNPSAFYAVSEMQVHGSCLCYGHADRCVPGSAHSSGQHTNLQVNGVCACQHNTAGVNCERCADFYNDQPWRPADARSTNACRPCNCNNHSQKCHFDAAVYRASGGVSGGVCDECRDGTAGQNCERCKSNYYRNPLRAIGHRDACVSCDCDPEGGVGGGDCEPPNGRCICKENTEGERCDRCKVGFYQISASNPQGCTRCPCDTRGARPDIPCHPEAGRCTCLPNVIGQRCDQCATNHWNLASGLGCQKCNCDPQNSYSAQCNQVTGHCLCKEGFGGTSCTECGDRFYGTVRTGCRACTCNFQGTIDGGCDKATGRCVCRPGFAGSRCDECQRGYCDRYPSCESCHPCFHFYDSDIQGLGGQLAALRNASMRMDGLADASLGPKVLQAEASLQQIQGILSNPRLSDAEITQVKTTFSTLRDAAQKINPELPHLEDSSTLSTDLKTINSDLLLVGTEYLNRKMQFQSASSDGPSGDCKMITTAYRTSTDAVNRVSETSRMIAKSQESRGSIEKLESEVKGDRSRLKALQEEMSFPDLTPTINRVCGGARATPCTPEECGGSVCPLDSAAGCAPGSDCRGVIPLSRSAVTVGKKTAGELQALNAQLQKTTEMIRSAEQSANQIQNSAQQLTERATGARTQMEGDMRRTRQFIQQVRDFLTDPSTDPATIQHVSEYVLSLQLPTDSSAILRKIKEIRDIAGKLPNVNAVLAQTNLDIEKAKELQREAEMARNKANAVEGNIEGVIANINQGRLALQDAEDTIAGAEFQLLVAKDRIAEIQLVLTPSEKALVDLTGRLRGFNDQVSRLRQESSQNQQAARQAQEAAAGASGHAGKAQQGFELVKQKYALLKSRVGQSSDLGALGASIKSLQTEADSLFQESMSMMSRMEEIELELQEGSKSLLAKSGRLAGLEKRVTSIRDYISQRVSFYATCV
ncbi:laminin subunit beta-3 [Ambystoma mexicanum]|uniref:laminin subunit beta-3 n=1 Tax=Ambystoma mexicanum TaxID=8296 RepID=UPI0037E83F36